MAAITRIVAKLMPVAGLAGPALSRILAFALVAFALAACANDKELMIPDEPADKLYNEGLYLLQHKKEYREAAKKFEEVDRQHPYSDWARKALLMQAYSYYEAKEYDDSITAAKRYAFGGRDAGREAFARAQPLSRRARCEPEWPTHFSMNQLVEW